MKIFQIVNDICYYDATPLYDNIEATVGKYPPDTLFTEAPDHVFEGWGYDGTKSGEERYIQPTPPEGWEYDPVCGGFYEIGTTPPSEIPTPDEDRDAVLIDLEYRTTLLELGVNNDAV